MFVKTISKTLIRIFLPLVGICCTFSCSLRNDLISIQDDIDDLRVQISEMNTSIVALQEILTEIWNGGLVTSVQAIEEDGVEIGYSMSFYDGRVITILQGVDGYSPKIGVAIDEDFLWYWTLDGEWLLDGAGNKIPAAAVNGIDGIDGITPLLKIYEEYWYISTDNGVTWTCLDRAQGKDAVSVFTGIDTSHDTYVEVFLADGGSVRIPRYVPLTLDLDVPEEENGLSPGETRQFHYSISGNVSDDTVVTAGTDGKYTLTIQRTGKASGIVSVTCPQEFHEGFVYILVNDGEGHSVVRVINFYERKISISTDFSFWVDCNGGTIKIPMQYNFPFTLVSDSNWLQPIQTKAAMRSGEIQIAVQPNQTNYVRTGHVTVRPVDHPEFVVETFTIEEASAYYYISPTSITVESAGRNYDVSIQSSRGVTVSCPDSWVHLSLSDYGNYNYNLQLNIDRNIGDSPRSTEISVKTGDGSVQLGTISITQLAYSVDHNMDFVLTVRATPLNDFTVFLPLRNWVDCVVDWGDGSMDTIRRSVWDDMVFHEYSVSEPTSFTVTISGECYTLNSNNMPAADAILSVEQWGNINVYDVYGAFSGCTRLSSIPEDTLGFFSNISDFSYVFYNCKSLESIPEGLFAHADNIQNMQYSFYYSGLKSVPSGLLKNLKSLKNVEGLFYECKNLKSVPKDLFSNCPNVQSITSFRCLFDGSGLEVIPKELFDSCTSATYFSNAFSRTKITTVPEGLFSCNKLITDVSYAFSDCSLMETIPVSIFDNNRRISNFYAVFSWSYPNLKPQESPYTVINGKKVHLYERRKYPDEFVEPSSYGGALSAFANHSWEWGIEEIPDGWR